MDFDFSLESAVRDNAGTLALASVLSASKQRDTHLEFLRSLVDAEQRERGLSEYLFDVAQEAKRIRAAFPTNPAQSAYDAHMLDYTFSMSGLSRAEFGGLEWKKLYETTKQEIEILRQHGISGIAKSESEKAIEAFYLTVSEVEAAAKQSVEDAKKTKRQKAILDGIALALITVIGTIVVLFFLAWLSS